MASKLLKKVRGRKNLEAAWRVIEENARTSKSPAVQGEIEKFRQDVTGNLEKLYRRLHQGTFAFAPAKGIPLPKTGGSHRGKGPGFRPIVLANAEARIVQRAILNVLTDLHALERYIANPYSFGGMRKSKHSQLAAVPAAINAVLDAIGSGARFVVCADISAFFTCISKSSVARLVAEATQDKEFMKFFESAIRVELSNMAQLRERAAKFPIEDIGVAQGNSLSPLLGNMLLRDFDEAMNAGDCHCKRYIDDFIILAPTEAAAAARLRLAKRLLAKHGMELSPSKTFTKPVAVDQGVFEFLGIELANGLIRPSKKAQRRLSKNIEEQFAKSARGFQACRRDQPINKSLSLIATLKRVDGIIRGWGKHYRFCNDEAVFARLDDRIDGLIRSYVGGYIDTRKRTSQTSRRTLLGIEQLSQIEREPLNWPKTLTKLIEVAA